MSKRILNILDTAYRATVEEQDDPVLWLTHTLKQNGADAHVLLRGNAVNYAVRGQDAGGLVFGDRAQTQPPRLADDLGRLIGKGVQVYLLDEDVALRGIRKDELVDGVRPVSRTQVPSLLDEFEQVWHW